MSRATCIVVAAAFAIAGCWARIDTPPAPPPTSASGRAPAGLDLTRICGDWEDAVGDDDDASSHVTFPELRDVGCFVPVHYGDGAPRAAAPKPGCGYPVDLRATLAQLAREIARYESVIAGRSETMPRVLACDLPDDVRRSAARVNARTLQRLARRLREGRRYPYAAAATFGFGYRNMAASNLVGWLPDEPCPVLGKRDMDLFSVNRVRAFRASEVQLAGIAPVVTVSGGAVHAPLYEAFMLDYLATCRFGVPRDAILLDPCADHTHTNLLNTGSLLVGMGARTAYVVTDDGLQSDYLQDWTLFSWIGGAIDQRSLRDWGYLLGSWRQASVGMRAGFWFTPYRFWGAEDPAHRSLTCSY